MDLLFTMCDTSNASDLVGELLQYLVRANCFGSTYILNRTVSVHQDADTPHGELSFRLLV